MKCHVKNVWTDEQLEISISMLLRIGVLVSSAIVLIGGIYFLIKYAALPPQYSTFLRRAGALSIHLRGPARGVFVERPRNYRHRAFAAYRDSDRASGVLAVRVREGKGQAVCRGDRNRAGNPAFQPDRGALRG